MDPLKILRTGLWITIINLAAADLAVCVVNFFVAIILCLEAVKLNAEQILVIACLSHLAISASFMLLAFFSLHVYTVTKFPFKAPHFWTRKRVVLCCVVIWLLAGLFGSATIVTFLHPDFDKEEKWWTVQVVIYCIIVIIQIVLKILTCWEIFKTRCNSGQSQSSIHRQITTTVTIMVVIQMFTTFPYFVIEQLRHDVFSQSYHLLNEITTYYWPFFCLNFCVNPIIYFLRLPDYRLSLLSLCRCRKHKNQTSSDLQRNKLRELPLHDVPPTTPQPPF